MSINLDAQQLAPGDRVRLYEVDCTAFDGPELYFHNHPISHSADELAAAAGDEGKLPAKSLWGGRVKSTRHGRRILRGWK